MTSPPVNPRRQDGLHCTATGAAGRKNGEKPKDGLDCKLCVVDLGVFLSQMIPQEQSKYRSSQFFNLMCLVARSRTLTCVNLK